MTYFPFAYGIPKLRVSPNPPFSFEKIRIIFGNFSSYSFIISIEESGEESFIRRIS